MQQYEQRGFGLNRFRPLSRTLCSGRSKDVVNEVFVCRHICIYPRPPQKFPLKKRVCWVFLVAVSGWNILEPVSERKGPIKSPTGRATPRQHLPQHPRARANGGNRSAFTRVEKKTTRRVHDWRFFHIFCRHRDQRTPVTYEEVQRTDTAVLDLACVCDPCNSWKHNDDAY